MKDGFRLLFNQLARVEPPASLFSFIVGAIQKKARRALFLHMCLLWVSTLGLFFTVLNFLQSEFYQYLLLIFSDGGVVLRVWGDMALILAESVPSVSGVGLLAALFMFLFSLRGVVAGYSPIYYQYK